VKYAWIKDHTALYPITLMCFVLGVSSSGFYAWLGRPPSRKVLRQKAVCTAVATVHEEHFRNYGSRKIAKELEKREGLEKACRNTVKTAMRKMGIEGMTPKKWKPMTTQSDPNHLPAPNTLDQEFTATTPNQKWVTDVTYIWTQAGWAYLSVMLDLFSRKVVGWHMDTTLETRLVDECLRKAVEARRPGPGLLHHSDRGCQYTSKHYRGILNLLRMECSMSRSGCCYDNAVNERFFWSLKYEWSNRKDYADLDEARFSVSQYITYYNLFRSHAALDYHTPDAFEAAYAAGIKDPQHFAA
jgi:putative transposase